jgi:hypothetical protein
MTALLHRKDPVPASAARGERPALTIRFAMPADAGALARLARLDSSRAPRGRVLVAEVGGELWAALSLDDQHAVADPFRPSGELVHLLAERGRGLHRAERREHRRGLRRLRPLSA